MANDEKNKIIPPENQNETRSEYLVGNDNLPNGTYHGGKIETGAYCINASARLAGSKKGEKKKNDNSSTSRNNG